MDLTLDYEYDDNHTLVIPKSSTFCQALYIPYIKRILTSKYKLLEYNGLNLSGSGCMSVTSKD